MVTKENISGIILAGGKSSRMGSDKGLLLLNEKPFIQYSIEALRPLVSEIIIVSDDLLYNKFGIKRINDKIKDAGPVSGIYSGLDDSTTEYNFILSCDIPLITTQVLKKLLHEASNEVDIVQTESNGKSMPLIALYRKSVKKHFHNALMDNERRLRVVVDQCRHKNVPLEKAWQFTTNNVNTKIEFEELKHAYNY